ncbi:MAG: AzlD domain-containing protein [Pseudomonadota bacterium]
MPTDSMFEAIWRDPLTVILLAAALTYATRAGGAIVLSRFASLPPRLEAALDAIPAAVLTALVVPALAALGPAEWLAAVMAVMLSFRFGLIVVVFAPTLLVVLLRYLGLG